MKVIKRVIGGKTSKHVEEGHIFGNPSFAVVPPGKCQFGEEFVKVQLMKREVVSHNVFLYTFATPDGKEALNLPTCACILARGGADKDGKPVVRPYTPCSTNAMKGEFQLMIKTYEKGVMTQYLSKLEAGASVEFKHIPFNVKIQYPFNKKFIGMIVGGTGITPMIQVLHAILGNKDDKTSVSMLYGNRTQDDILAHSTLDKWGKKHHQLQVTHVLSNAPADSKWKGKRGYITKDLVHDHFHTPSPDMMIFVCGPPAMYDSFCGPRDDKEHIVGILGELGYTKDHVYKF